MVVAWDGDTTAMPAPPSQHLATIRGLRESRHTYARLPATMLARASPLKIMTRFGYMLVVFSSLALVVSSRVTPVIIGHDTQFTLICFAAYTVARDGDETAMPRGCDRWRLCRR